MRSPSNNVRRARPLLGTLVEISCCPAIGKDVHAHIDQAFAAVEQVHQLMSFHDADSDLGRLNAAPAMTPVRVHPWTYTVIQTAKRMWSATAGLFDCCVAPRLVTAGFLPGANTGSVPPCGSMDDIELLDGEKIRLNRPALLDLGGIAKGFAVDMAVEKLQACGIQSGTVNAGGDLRLFGTDKAPVHVRHPQAPGELVYLGDYANIAVASSSHYFSKKTCAGRLVTPIVDPHSGRLSDTRCSATVFAASCMIADALTKPVLLTNNVDLDCLRLFSAQACIFE